MSLKTLTRSVDAEHGAGTLFPIGDFINACISFFLVAAAVYFFVVVPINVLIAGMHRSEKPPDPTTKKCPECLSQKFDHETIRFCSTLSI